MMPIGLIAGAAAAHRSDQPLIWRLNRYRAVCAYRGDDPGSGGIDVIVRAAAKMIVVAASIKHNDLRSRRDAARPAQDAFACVAVESIYSYSRVVALCAQNAFELSWPSLIRADAFTVRVTGAQGKHFDRFCFNRATTN